jgi:hypothetical protein
MTTYRSQGQNAYDIGSAPPEISWTVVRGDTSSFRVTVTDENRVPIDLTDWTLAADIVRPPLNTVIVSLTPSITPDDGTGQFTVALASAESELLETGDLFDIQVSDDTKVWTVGKGSMILIEDYTD